MKLTMIALALVAVVNAPAFAATVIDGCEVKPISGTNAFQKVDVTCEFENAPTDPRGWEFAFDDSGNIVGVDFDVDFDK